MTRPIKKGLPSQPVRIVGFDESPKAGDPFICVESEEDAKELIERRRASRETEAIMSADGNNGVGHAELQSSGKHLMSFEWKSKLESRHGIDAADGESRIRIPVVLRADADGSLAALQDSIVALGEDSSHDVVVDPIQTGIGPVTPADIELAKESNAAVVCFNVKNEAAREASNASIKILSSEVIYTLLDEAKIALGSYLPSISREVVHGRAKVNAIFDIGGLDTRVAGLHVLDGTLYRDNVAEANLGGASSVVSLYRVIRNGQVVEETVDGLPATSLKHFKEDVSEIGRGKECGLSLANFSSFEEGDEIECWSVSPEQQVL